MSEITPFMGKLVHALMSMRPPQHRPARQLDRAEIESGKWFEMIGAHYEPLDLPPIWLAFDARIVRLEAVADWLDETNAKVVERWIVKSRLEGVPVTRTPTEEAFLYQRAILYEFATDADMVAFKMRWM